MIRYSLLASSLFLYYAASSQSAATSVKGQLVEINSKDPLELVIVALRHLPESSVI